MTCGASVANRAGLHLPCMLDANHEGSCIPQLPSPQVRPSPAPYWMIAREHEFVGHLLAIIESAGDTMTFVEAINVARALLRARIGRAPF